MAIIDFLFYTRGMSIRDEIKRHMEERGQAERDLDVSQIEDEVRLAGVRSVNDLEPEGRDAIFRANAR